MLFCPIFIPVRPEIRPVPKTGLVVVREGEPAELGCKVTRGSPEPEVRWTRKVRKSMFRFNYFFAEYTAFKTF